MIEIKNLSKKYKNRIVLNDVTISFPEKGVTVIVGVNGSGKTTLMDCIVGMKSMDSGEIFVDSFSYSSDNYKSKLFYIPSDFYLPEFMTGIEYLHFILSRYVHSNRLLIPDFIDLFGLESAQNQLIESYSFGMKKKIQIIAALLSNAEYILCDEVFSGLDFETELLLTELLKVISKKSSIVLVSHNKLVVEKFSDNIYLMRNGKLSLFSGIAEDLVKKISLMESVYDKIQWIKTSFVSG